MRTKQEVERELREITESEEETKREKQRQENYTRFKERDGDWMIGRAHADISFLNERYMSDKEKELIPESVSVSGNCGTTYYPKALLTKSTKTYFHNVWRDKDRSSFQKKLTELAQKEIEKIAHSLPCVLEMMGLQSNHYYLTSDYFPKDKINEIKSEIEAAQAEILDTYKDAEFLKLFRKSIWSEDVDEDGERKDEVDLSHSRMILYRYILKHRPKLQKKFKGTAFYESWKGRIEAKYD